MKQLREDYLKWRRPTGRYPGKDGQYVLVLPEQLGEARVVLVVEHDETRVDGKPLPVHDDVRGVGVAAS